MKVVYNRMLNEAGVECIFYTHLADVLVHNNEVKAVLLAGLEGTYLLEADVFADCTGDAQLCFWQIPILWKPLPSMRECISRWYLD